MEIMLGYVEYGRILQRYVHNYVSSVFEMEVRLRCIAKS